MASFAPLYRSLASMHRAGIPWPRAVESAASGDRRFDDVVSALDRGTPLAQAFAAVVDPLDVAILEAGERDGSLEQVFQDLARAHDEADKRRRERGVRTAYPILLGHLAAVLMAVPDLLRGNLLGALGWAVLILAPLWTWLIVQRRVDRRERPAPQAGAPPAAPPAVWPFRNRVEEADARGLEALGRLYEAGVPLGDALDLALRAGWGGRVAVDLAGARAVVARGDSLSDAWRQLPPDLAGRFRAAEESGSLGEALRRAADDLRFATEMRRQKTAQILPVILLLGVGGIIAVRVLSFYAALYGNLGR